MKLILIGYMGSGKSTLGKKLANKCQLPFLDSDQLIEAQTGHSVSDIFAQFGEAHFRQLEKEVIERLHDHEAFVLSCGGGLPCFNNQMEVLNKLGITIYLERPPKELARRLLHSKTERPLIQDKSLDELVSFIEMSLENRKAYYEKAQVTVPRSVGTPKQLHDFLINAGVVSLY